MKLENLNLKYLMRAHTVLGLVAIFIFYICTYFGAITVFLPYISAWENPSRHFVLEEKNINLDKVIPQIIKDKNLEKTISITLPTFRDKTISIKDEKSETFYINPNTNTLLDTRNENNFVTNFFNEIHMGKNIPSIGQVITATACILMIFLSISGLILWLNNRKNKRKNEKVWMRWHRISALVLLPFILIFSITASVTGFMFPGSAPIAYTASNTKEIHLEKIVFPILFPKDEKVSQSFKSDMLDISILQNKALEYYPDLKIESIKLFNWNEQYAQIKFTGHLKNNRALSARHNRMYIVLKGINGELIKKKDLSNSNTTNKLLSVFYFFHFIPDESIIIRIFYFTFGIVMAASLAFGFLIYSDKKSKKTKNDLGYYSKLNTFAMAVMIGIIPASALVLCLHWIIPFEILEREFYIKSSFYGLWLLTFVYSAFKNSALKVTNNLLVFSALILVFTVLIHGYKTNWYFWLSYIDNMNDIFFVDFALLSFALVFCIFAKNSTSIEVLKKYK